MIKQCEEDSLLSKLGVVLFEQLGEEYPDTLGRCVSHCDNRFRLLIVFVVSSLRLLLSRTSSV